MRKFLIQLSIKFFDFIYKKQNQYHQKRMNKILSAASGDYKFLSSNGATLSIKEKGNEKLKKNQEKIEKIVTSCLDEPEKFFKYIEGAKTKIYVNKFASKILSLIDEEEGFILPKSGLKALYLNLFICHKLSFKTKEMFAISSYNVNIYAFIYQFYNWYCYKLGANGFDEDIQNNFKHVFEICETSKINTLTFQEILDLKTAIKQDIEAIDFVKKIAIKNSMAKKNLNKIKLGETVKI